MRFNFEIVNNKIPQLMANLNGVKQIQNQREAMRAPAERVGFVLLSRMKHNAPVGQVEPDYSYTDYSGVEHLVSHGRPSLRLHGMTLLEGWGQPEINPTDTGVSVKILSNAPHMPILLDGSPEHRLPKSGVMPMSYWFFRENRAQLSYFINHPGFTSKKEFVSRSVKERVPIIIFQLRSGLLNALAPIRQMFNR
jgi:hypothetical protein